jgi:hypothetical protein
MDENIKFRDRDLIISSVVAIPTGAVIILCSLAIFSGGDLQAALAMILISIVCTLGISLLIWIPLCWLAGMLTIGMSVGLVKLLSSQVQQKVPGEAIVKPAIVDRALAERQSLANYIRKAQKKGFSASQIESRLRQEGWSVTEIANAQALVESTS